MALELSHPDFWTRALQFTPTIHRDLYPALSHEAASIQQIAQGKVVIVTGAGSGFGKVCFQSVTNPSTDLFSRELVGSGQSLVQQPSSSQAGDSSNLTR